MGTGRQLEVQLTRLGDLLEIPVGLEYEEKTKVKLPANAAIWSVA
jgi:hypothetical protein